MVKQCGPYRCQVQVKTGIKIIGVFLMMLGMMLLTMLVVLVKMLLALDLVTVMMLLSILMVKGMILRSDINLCWLSWNLGSLWLVMRTGLRKKLRS